MQSLVVVEIHEPRECLFGMREAVELEPPDDFPLNESSVVSIPLSMPGNDVLPPFGKKGA
jgi:hypothetical protein